MKNNIFIAAFVLLGILGNSISTPAQQEKRGSSVRFNESGILVEFRTETDPPQSGNQFEARGTTAAKGERNTTHRIFVDQTSGAIFGYDLEVQPSTVANHFMLSIKPLSVDAVKVKPLAVKAAPVKPLSVEKIPLERVPAEIKERLVRNAAKAESTENPTAVSGTASPVVADKNKNENATLTADLIPTKYPPDFLIEDGGTFAVDVFVNPQTGVKIVDYVKISSESKQVSGRTATPQTPRDFTPDAVELSVKNFRLLINEQTVIGTESPIRGGVTGAVIWIFLPGKGRFIFSLTPREGFDFQKLGMIQGNKISFRLGGDYYEWISSAPVFGGEGGNWNLWVLHDADYAPKNEVFTEGGYLIGAADRIEYLLKKK